MSPVIEGLVALLVVVGAAFAFLGSLGLARFPDFYMRLHGPSKATTLGIGSLLAASLVWFGVHGSITLHELLITLFVALTTPISGHFLARAARRRRVPQWRNEAREGRAADPHGTDGVRTDSR